MVSKTPEGDHLPVNIEIVHDGTSLKKNNKRPAVKGPVKEEVLGKKEICSCRG